MHSQSVLNMPQTIHLTTKYSFLSTEKNTLFQRNDRVPSTSLIRKHHFSLRVCGGSSQSCSWPLQDPLLPYSSSCSQTSLSEMNCLSVLNQQKARHCTELPEFCQFRLQWAQQAARAEHEQAQESSQPRGTGEPAGTSGSCHRTAPAQVATNATPEVNSHTGGKEKVTYTGSALQEVNGKWRIYMPSSVQLRKHLLQALSLLFSTNNMYNGIIITQ